ncbi:MAG: aminomethyltransferase beta-barrel domain-containing protein, partial [Cyanobacteria bacterium J06636_28]
ATAIPLSDGSVKLVFAEPQFSVSPGQAAVWYDDDTRVLGGGLIRPFTQDEH